MIFSLPGRRAVKQAWAKETFKYGKETLNCIVPFWQGGRPLATMYFRPPEYIDDDKHITLVYDFCAANHMGYCTYFNFYALKKKYNTFLNIRVILPGRKHLYETLEQRERIINAIGVTPIDVPFYKNKGYVANFYIELEEKYISRHIHN